MLLLLELLRNEAEEFMVLALFISLLEDSRVDNLCSPDDEDVKDPKRFGFLVCKGNRERDVMFSEGRWISTDIGSKLAYRNGG